MRASTIDHSPGLRGPRHVQEDRRCGRVAQVARGLRGQAERASLAVGSILERAPRRALARRAQAGSRGGLHRRLLQHCAQAASGGLA
eukprot:2751058-Lingulodinium_polyedra.AAC.2